MDKEISSNFPNSNFNSQSLFIVTFDTVSSYKHSTESNNSAGGQGSSTSSNVPGSSSSNTMNAMSIGNNTFQLIIASNGSSSYAMIMYPTNGIQWIRSEGKQKNTPEAKAQAGFFGPRSDQMTLLRGSGSDQMYNLDKVSNLANPTPGVWLFKIGRLDGPIVEPVSTGSATTGRDTCSRTNHPCIPSAICQDKEQGTCCTCKDGYVGNGISCFPIGEYEFVWLMFSSCC